MDDITREEAVAQYPWRIVRGDAGTPQSFWHYQFFTDAEKEDLIRRGGVRHLRENFGATLADRDGPRIKALLKKEAYKAS